MKLSALLINPNAGGGNAVMPLGLGYIAAMLAKRSLRVGVVDAWAENLSAAEVAERVKKFGPEVVGISVLSPNYQAAASLLGPVRSAVPDCKIVLGGPHPSALPEDTLWENSEIDAAVVGEGDMTMLELVRVFQDGGDLGCVDGIAFRKGAEVVLNKARNPVKDLDSLPFPARGIFPIGKYRTHPPYGRKTPYMSLITTRGCPYKCAFCSNSVFGRSYRGASPKKVADELEHLKKGFGVREVHFYDDDFPLNFKRAMAICDEIMQRGIDIDWSCTARADNVSAELLKNMKRSGCWLISYGVESGDQEMLDRMRKAVTIEQIEEAFRLAREAGIGTLGYFMVGFPGETRQTIRKTIDFAKKLSPDFASWCIFVVFPGTHYYNLHASTPQAQQMPRSPFGHGSSIFYEGELSLEELRKATATACREFYFRASYIIKQLRKIGSFRDFLVYARGWWEVVKYIAPWPRSKQ